MNKASGYTVAGMETLMTIINNFMLNKKGDWKEHFTRENINNFFGNVCKQLIDRTYFVTKAYNKTFF